MEGTDISEVLWYSIDDHTYYGNGCDAFYENGSKTACSSRSTNTDDGETQDIGVYYSFQAASSGSGWQENIADNTNAPDTFCPLGWQLPYGGTDGDYYDQSKSWRFLFGKFGFELTTTDSPFNLFRKYPFSNIRAGRYNGEHSDLSDFGRGGFYHSVTQNNNITNVYRLLSYASTNNGTLAQRLGPKREGQALRCGEFTKDTRECLCYFCKHNHKNQGYGTSV